MSEHDLDALLERGRRIWGDGSPVSLGAVGECVSVIAGDLSRACRSAREGRGTDHEAVRKELGNLLLSARRWVDDLGYDVDECLELAERAQVRYVQGLATGTGGAT